MACTPTPTLTQYELVTTSTVTTTSSESVTTNPPDVTTIRSTTCLASSAAGASNDTEVCLSSTTVEVVSTIDEGDVQTVQVPIVLTIPVVTSQPTATLFAPCTTDPDDGPSDPPLPPSPPLSPPPLSLPPTSLPSFPTGPVVVSISTPPPSVIVTAVSSTLSDGAVVVTYQTSTSTLPPTPVFIPTSLVGDDGHNHPHDESAIDVGPIVGGVLGGFFGMLGIVALMWFLWRKRRSWRERYAGPLTRNYSPTLYSPRPRHGKSSSPPPGLEPKPYEYGLVGRPPSTPSFCSSPGPSPPPTRPQSFSALSAMTAHTGPTLSPTTPPAQSQVPNEATPNLLHTTSPIVAPTRPITPMTPLSPAFLGPAVSTGAGRHGASASEASVGTAVSYPFPVLPPTSLDGHRDSQDTSGSEGVDGGGRASEDAEGGWTRRPTRLSLTLANWNPETDGELFPRASSDDGRPAG
ncbi:hypothetical protein BC628DRAFT_1086764 [Trametes gibbosa]|nr:hypothetical protein BC628DRAFT_1086764 [Trametes gibbosa]